MKLKIRHYEGIAALFLLAVESFESDSLASEDVEIGEIMGELNFLIRGSDLSELEKSEDSFDLIIDEETCSFLPKEIETLISVAKPENEIKVILNGIKTRVSLLGLLGIIVCCIEQIFQSALSQSLHYELRRIAPDFSDEICSKKELVIRHYIRKAEVFIIREYWEEFGEINQNFGNDYSEKLSGFICCPSESIFYPSVEKYIEIAYIVALVFATALAKHYRAG